MKRWLIPAVLVLLNAAAWHWRDDLRHHLLGSGPQVSTAAIEEERARLVFRNGPSRDAPDLALQRLLASGTVRRRRLQDPAFNADVSASLAHERRAWARQWEKDAERRQRMDGQRLTEGAMENIIRDNLLDLAWIEHQIAGAAEATEAEIAAAFKAQHGHLEIPQAHRVAHLFLSRHGAGKKDRLKEIEKIHARLLAGESWDTLVRAFSEDPRTKKSGGDLGWVGAPRMPAEFIAAVQRLPFGRTSGPVATPLGWHLVRLLERRPARLPGLEEVRAELKAALEQKKRRAALERLVQDLQGPGASRP